MVKRRTLWTMRFVMSALLCTFFGALTLHPAAAAEPYFAATEVQDMEYAAGGLIDDSGNTASFALLAVRYSADSAEIFIRICPEYAKCTDYHDTLGAEEYYYTPSGHLDADVDGLGNVHAQFGGTGWFVQEAHRAAPESSSAIDAFTTAPIPSASSGVRESGTHASSFYGPWYQDWGKPGIEGHGVSVVWLKP